MDKQKENEELLIAASIIAAIRLREDLITLPPKVISTVSDSVQLARMVWQEIQRQTNSGQGSGTGR